VTAGNDDFGAVIVEVEGVSTLDEDVGSSDATTEPTISITPVTSDPILIISGVSVRKDTATSFTPEAGMTELYDDNFKDASNSGPWVAVNYRVVEAPSGSYTVGSTYGSGSRRAIIAASFVRAAGDVIWILGPNAIDGDDDTFEYIA
jgi:hypothetical protein